MRLSHFPVTLISEDTPDGKQLIVQVPMAEGEAPFEIRLSQDQALTFAKLITKEFREPVAVRQDAESSAAFERFWQAYPTHRRVDRAGCSRKWAAMGLDKVADRVIADIQSRAASTDWIKDRGQYVPMSATYLNQRRWEASEAASDDAMQSV